MIAALTKLYRRIVLGFIPVEGLTPGQIAQAESDCQIIRGNKPANVQTLAAPTPAPERVDLADKLIDWLASQSGDFTMTHVVNGAIGMRRGQLSHVEITRIGLLLTRLGCTSRTTRQGNGNRIRMWSPPAANPNPAPKPERRAPSYN